MEQYLLDSAARPWSLVLVGTALILVNILSHVIIEELRARSARSDLVERELKQVLGAAGGLLSRICDALATYAEEFRQEIRHYGASDGRLQALTPVSMRRLESTVYRLVYFLATAKAFERRTAETAPFPLLERARQYLSHKIPVVLRGNLYGLRLLETEIQEELAAVFFRPGGGEDLSVGRFCEILRADRRGRELFVKVLELFLVHVPPRDRLREDCFKDVPAARRLMALAHLGVYLADFCQDFSRTSQWEEYRFLFARFIRSWNSENEKKRYLYEPGDLETDNYIRSYPGRLSPLGLLENLGRRVYFMPFLVRQGEHLWKLATLNIRGGRAMRRHDLKEVWQSGIRIKENGVWKKFLWAGDISEVYREVQDYSRRRVGR